MRRFAGFAVLFVLFACGSSGSGTSFPDPGAPPADAIDEEVAVADIPAADEAAPDTAVADLPLADVPPADGTAAEDATPDTAPDVPFEPLPGFGAISGACGVLDDAEWDSTEPLLFRQVIDFGTIAWDKTLLSDGGEEIIDDGNLGGSSVESEAIAYDVLYRCEGAALLKTEGEIGYVDAGGKKTDELVSIDGRKVGVSVVRAYHYKPTTPWSEEAAGVILEDKLQGILLSGPNAVAADAWERSILSVVAWDDAHADFIEAAWAKMDPSLRASTIVYLTVTNGSDDFIY